LYHHKRNIKEQKIERNKKTREVDEEKGQITEFLNTWNSAKAFGYSFVSSQQGEEDKKYKKA
jgi:hypothetical protein